MLPLFGDGLLRVEEVHGDAVRRVQNSRAPPPRSHTHSSPLLPAALVPAQSRALAYFRLRSRQHRTQPKTNIGIHHIGEHFCYISTPVISFPLHLSACLSVFHGFVGCVVNNEGTGSGGGAPALIQPRRLMFGVK
jgi:hypothetical protein